MRLVGLMPWPGDMEPANVVIEWHWIVEPARAKAILDQRVTDGVMLAATKLPREEPDA
jgi:hypothetical protein